MSDLSDSPNQSDKLPSRVVPASSAVSGMSGMSSSSHAVREARISLVVQMFRDRALGCGCRESQTCPFHTFGGFGHSIRLIIEDAVFEAIACHVGVWTRESWIHTVCYASPVDTESQNNLFRRMMALRSDMRHDARLVHNAWMRAGKPDSFPKHESGCISCIDPNIDLKW